MFLIKCNKCNFRIKTKGDKKSIEEEKLSEIKNNCASCGKIRKFYCPKCKNIAKMFRIN
jgi:hypothetical protein